MKEIFAEIGVEVTKENRKEIDRKIHSLLGVQYKDCPTTWKHIKARLVENREAFINELQTRLT